MKSRRTRAGSCRSDRGGPIEALEGQRRRATCLETRGGGDQRLAMHLIEAARPTSTEVEARAKARILLGAAWDAAEAAGNRHAMEMIGVAFRAEISRLQQGWTEAAA